MKAKYFYSVFYLITLMGITSCSASLTVEAKNISETNAEFTLDLGKTLSETIKSIGQSFNSEVPQNEPLFTEKDIKNIFSQSDFSNLKISLPDEKSLKVNGTLKSSESKNINGIRTADFVSCTSKSLTVKFTRENLEELYISLPEDYSAYLDLTMAPVFTDEDMDKDEYISLIETVYGSKLANEIRDAKVNLKLKSPAGKTKSFVISLPDILCLEKPLTYSLSW